MWLFLFFLVSLYFLRVEQLVNELNITGTEYGTRLQCLLHASLNTDTIMKKLKWKTRCKRIMRQKSPWFSFYIWNSKMCGILVLTCFFLYFCHRYAESFSIIKCRLEATTSNKTMLSLFKSWKLVGCFHFRICPEWRSDTLLWRGVILSIES